MYVLDKIRHGERCVSLDDLWVVMDAEDRQRILRALSNGELLAEGRWVSAGHPLPHPDVVYGFYFINREAWYSQEFDTAADSIPVCLCPDMDDPTQGFIDIQLINSEKLIEILDLDPDQRGPEINLAELAVDGHKTSVKVWAAMAAMAAQKRVPLSPTAIAKALLDRHDLWARGSIDFDRMRKYATLFVKETKAFE